MSVLNQGLRVLGALCALLAFNAHAALARTNLFQENSSASFGTGAYTTGSYSTTSGRLEWVYIAALEETMSGLVASDLTISGGNVSSWSFCGSGTQTGSGWSYGGRFAYGVANASGSTTLTLDAGTHNVHIYRAEVYEYTGFGGSPCGTTGNAAPDTDGDGAYSVTLGSSPATTSEVMGVALGTGSTSGTGYSTTPGAAFTELFDVAPDNGFMISETEIRTGSTSTTVDWVDLHVGADTPDERGGFAAEVVAAGAGMFNPISGRFLVPIAANDGFFAPVRRVLSW